MAKNNFDLTTQILNLQHKILTYNTNFDLTTQILNLQHKFGPYKTNF